MPVLSSLDAKSKDIGAGAASLQSSLRTRPCPSTEENSMWPPWQRLSEAPYLPEACPSPLQQCIGHLYHVSLLIPQQDHDGAGSVINHCSNVTQCGHQDPAYNRSEQWDCQCPLSLSGQPLLRPHFRSQCCLTPPAQVQLHVISPFMWRSFPLFSFSHVTCFMHLWCQHSIIVLYPPLLGHGPPYADSISVFCSTYSFFYRISHLVSPCCSPCNDLQRSWMCHLLGLCHQPGLLPVFVYQVLPTVYPQIWVVHPASHGMPKLSLLSHALHIDSGHPDPLLSTPCLQSHAHHPPRAGGPAKCKLAFTYQLIVCTHALHPSNLPSHAIMSTAFTVV